MNEVTRTVVFAGAALGLVALAGVTAPRVRQPALFSDRGESFFPGFTDPGAVRSLELVQFSEHSGNVEPLKVLNRNGIWTIPSHYGYPADVKDRLAQLAAAVITLRKDDVRSDALPDHADRLLTRALLPELEDDEPRLVDARGAPFGARRDEGSGERLRRRARSRDCSRLFGR